MGTDILTVAELTTMGLAVRGEKGRVNQQKAANPQPHSTAGTEGLICRTLAFTIRQGSHSKANVKFHDFTDKTFHDLQ